MLSAQHPKLTRKQLAKYTEFLIITVTLWSKGVVGTVYAVRVSRDTVWKWRIRVIDQLNNVLDWVSIQVPARLRPHTDLARMTIRKSAIRLGLV